MSDPEPPGGLVPRWLAALVLFGLLVAGACSAWLVFVPPPGSSGG